MICSDMHGRGAFHPFLHCPPGAAVARDVPPDLFVDQFEEFGLAHVSGSDPLAGQLLRVCSGFDFCWVAGSSLAEINPQPAGHLRLVAHASERFLGSVLVDLASEDLANSVGICAKQMDNVGVGPTLIAKNMGCNSLFESKVSSFDGDAVKLNTSQRMTTIRANCPVKISHLFNSLWLRAETGWIGSLTRSAMVRPFIEGTRTSAGAEASILSRFTNHVSFHSAVQQFAFFCTAFCVLARFSKQYLVVKGGSGLSVSVGRGVAKTPILAHFQSISIFMIRLAEVSA